MRSVLAVLSLLSAVPGSAVAGPPTVVRYLDGFTCARLNVAPGSALKPGEVVWLRTQPAVSAPTATMASSILFVSSPPVTQSGFTKVLQINGAPAWIETSRIEAYDPFARCRPALMSNGRVGAAP